MRTAGGVLAVAVLAAAAAFGAEDGMGVSVVAPSAAEGPTAAAVADGGVLRLALRSEASVRGRWVRLADVAELSGLPADRLAAAGETRLAHVPLPGAERVMTASEIGRKLAALGVRGPVSFAAEEGAAGEATVRIRAAVKPLGGEDLVRCGHDFLAGRAARPGTEVRIEDPDAPRAVPVPDADIELKAQLSEGRRAGASGLTTVAVEGWLGEERVARVLLSYRVHVRGKVTRAAHAIEPGETLAAADLEEAEQDLGQVPDDALTDASSLTGLRVVRPIPAGSWVRKGAVAQPLRVRRGAQVTLIARIGQVEARAAAQSKEDGAAGEVVTVVNLDSKRALKARVVDQDVVEAVIP